MSKIRGERQKRLLRRLLELWMLAPDDRFGSVLAQALDLGRELEQMTDDEVFRRLNGAIEERMDRIYRRKLHAQALETDDNVGAWAQFGAGAYVNAQRFLDDMKKHTPIMTKQEYASIKEMALHVDVEAAQKRLVAIVERKHISMARRQV